MIWCGIAHAGAFAVATALEGHENFDREFWGEVLQPSTSRLLDEMGLLDYVKAQPHSLLIDATAWTRYCHP